MKSLLQAFHFLVGAEPRQALRRCSLFKAASGVKHPIHAYTCGHRIVGQNLQPQQQNSPLLVIKAPTQWQKGTQYMASGSLDCKRSRLTIRTIPDCKASRMELTNPSAPTNTIIYNTSWSQYGSNQFSGRLALLRLSCYLGIPESAWCRALCMRLLQSSDPLFTQL